MTVMSATSWLRYSATSRKVAGSILHVIFGIFDITLPAAIWPWGVDSVSNINEYLEYFLGVKAAGA
jgi:hypothetical protein